jgi:hypothetical protein
MSGQQFDSVFVPQSQPIFDNLLGTTSFNDWLQNWDSLIATNLSAPVSFDVVMNNLASSVPEMTVDELFVPVRHPLSIKTSFAHLSPLDMVQTSSMSSGFSLFSPSDSCFSISPSSNCSSPLQELPMKVNSKIPEDAYTKVQEEGRVMYHCKWKNCKLSSTLVET